MKKAKLYSIILSFVALLITVLLAWFSGLEFSAWLTSQSLSRFWLFLSDFGNVYGVIAVITISSIFVAFTKRKLSAKLLTFVLCSLPIMLYLWGFAKLNENIIKTQAEVFRPYVLVLEDAGLLSSEKFYDLKTKAERSKFLKKIFADNEKSVKYIHPSIRDHWISETGYSFPSGHSLTAFAMYTLLAFIYLRSFRKPWRAIVILPLLLMILISVSRVAVGAHSAIDVSFGALSGWFVSSLIILTGFPKRLCDFGKDKSLKE